MGGWGEGVNIKLNIIIGEILVTGCWGGVGGINGKRTDYFRYGVKCCPDKKTHATRQANATRQNNLTIQANVLYKLIILYKLTLLNKLTFFNVF